jgi:hypothetical protein
LGAGLHLGFGKGKVWELEPPWQGQGGLDEGCSADEEGLVIKGLSEYQGSKICQAHGVAIDSAARGLNGGQAKVHEPAEVGLSYVDFWGMTPDVKRTCTTPLRLLSQGHG